jgi:hypothetical protein
MKNRGENMLLIKIEDARGNLVGAFTAEQGEFKTGSKGYKATAKVKIDGKRYQTQVNMVEIGSKPEAETEAETSEATE